MAGQSTKIDRALELVRERGALRPRDLAEEGIPADYLDRLCRLGRVERIARGLYADPSGEVSEHHSLMYAVRLIPHGIICLLSALRFYGLTTQSPGEVWLTIASKAWAPKIEYPRIRYIRSSGAALTSLVETRLIEGVEVKIYSPAKTVADCFKHRGKVGLDTAIEALRDAYRGKLATLDELYEASRACRMENVMRPYLESLI